MTYLMSSKLQKLIMRFQRQEDKQSISTKLIIGQLIWRTFIIVTLELKTERIFNTLLVDSSTDIYSMSPFVILGASGLFCF